MPVSITDVARKAGVSPGTVSHVLNGNVRAGIAPTTQARVRAAAAELGYEPNRMARMLGRGRTETLALFISGLNNPFFVQMLESAERTALEAGYQVLMETAPPNLENLTHKAKLRGWPMDGVLMWTQPLRTLTHYLGGQAEGLPVVYMGGQPRPDHSDAVYFDVYDGARRMAEHLIAAGYRRPAYITPYPWALNPEVEPRHQAYRQICEAAGVPLEVILMERHEQSRRAGLETGLLLAQRSTRERPDVALCFNDVVAEGVLFGLRRAGLACPEEISVVGFDGIPEAQYLDTPLTTVALPTDALCGTSLKLLIKRIREGADGSPEQHIVPAKLIFGKTTLAAPGTTGETNEPE